MKQIVIIFELFFAHFVLIYLNISPVLTTNLTAINDKYIGKDKKSDNPCILTAFNATVTINPIDPTFAGSTYSFLSPETSIAKTTYCNPTKTVHYYRYKDIYNQTSKRQTLFTVGFEIGVGNEVEMHFKYMEVFCDDPNGCLRDDITYCRTKDIEELKRRKCLKMSASFSLIWLKEGQTYQCSHNSMQNIRDVVYFNEIPEFRGTFEVDLHYVRIDVTNSTETFNPINYCLLDWVLDTTVIITVSSIMCLILLLCIFKCLYDCRSDAKRGKYRTKDKSSKKWNKCQKESEMEKLGPALEI